MTRVEVALAIGLLAVGGAVASLVVRLVRNRNGPVAPAELLPESDDLFRSAPLLERRRPPHAPMGESTRRALQIALGSLLLALAVVTWKYWLPEVLLNAAILFVLVLAAWIRSRLVGEDLRSNRWL